MPAYSVRPDLAQFFTYLGQDISLIPGFVAIVNDPDHGVLQGWVAVAKASQAQMPPTMSFSTGSPPAADIRLPKDSGYSFGEVLLAATWQIGFSPRLYYRTDKATETSPPPKSQIAFVPFPAPSIASAPVSLDVLAKSASVGQFPTPAGQAPGGGDPGVRALRKVLDDIQQDYQVAVRAEASILDQPVSVQFAEFVSLPYVLDAIALYLDAIWDWNENEAVLRPRRGCGGCDDRLTDR